MMKYFSIILFLLLSISLISSAPVKSIVTTQNTNIQIISYPFDIVKQNTNLSVRFWAFNGSNGILFKNNSIYCTLNLLEAQGKNIFMVTIPISQFGILNNTKACQNCFWYDISGNNFTNIGIYGLNIRCQTYDNVSLGGDEMMTLTVTPTGKERIGLPETIIYLFSQITIIMLFFFIIYLSILIKEPRYKFIILVLATLILLIIIFYSLSVLYSTNSIYLEITEGFETFLTVLYYALYVLLTGLLILSLWWAWNLWQIKRGFKE